MKFVPPQPSGDVSLKEIELIICIALGFLGLLFACAFIGMTIANYIGIPKRYGAPLGMPLAIIVIGYIITRVHWLALTQETSHD